MGSLDKGSVPVPSFLSLEDRMFLLFSLFFLPLLSLGNSSPSLGPFRGLASKPSPTNPTCQSFTLQDDIPEGTVQIITYGAPEMSSILTMGLTGDGKTFPEKGQTVSAHYVLFLDDCTLIESSRDQHGKPFSFVIGAGSVIEGWEVGIPQMSLGQRASVTLSPDMAYGEEGAGGVIPPNATLIFDIEIVDIQ